MTNVFGRRKNEAATSCELFAMYCLSGIWGDCLKFQDTVSETISFSSEAFFLEEVIFQTHLLTLVSPKIAGKHNQKLMNAISTHMLGGIEQFNVRKRPNFELEFKLLLAKRQKNYFNFEWLSAFTTNDYPDPNIFSFAAKLFFTDPAMLDKCMNLKKNRAQQTYAQLVELIYTLN